MNTLIETALTLLLTLRSLGPGPGVLLDADAQTFPGVGAAQGVSVIDGFVYVYGDIRDAHGIIRETRFDNASRSLVPTGRDIRLTIAGNNVSPHPTGLTTHPTIGTFLGDTVRRRGRIFHVDFDRMRQTHSLDEALLNTTFDDLAVNGTRPEFVRVGDRWLIATSDYGDVANHVRLYDPHKLKTARYTSQDGVLVAKFPCGPFVQTLCWIDEKGWLVLVQNTTPGLGWRLTFLDLAASVELGREVIVKTQDLWPACELEGFDLIDDDTAVLVSAFRKDNVRVGEVRMLNATHPTPRVSRDSKRSGPDVRTN